MKGVVTGKNFFETLDTLRGQVKAAGGEYRQQVYGFMARAWLIVLLLRKDKDLQRKFIRRAKLKVPGKGKVAFKVVTEVMAYVMGAKTETARKLAWKRGRVIEFLHDQGIKIAKIAAEIRSRGGIEAVLKEAAKRQPRRDKGSPGKKTNVKKAAAIFAMSGHKSDRDTPDRDESDSMTARSSGTSQRNDGQVIMLMPMLIKLSDRDMLEELPAESRVRIVGTRINQKGAKIKVSRIKKLKSGVRKLEDDDEWA
jgi:hypothetical protein